MKKKLCNYVLIPHGICVVFKINIAAAAFLVSFTIVSVKRCTMNIRLISMYINMVEIVALLLSTSHFGCKAQYVIFSHCCRYEF